MPYVPSEKTDGKSQDRNILDAAVELAAKQAATEIDTVDNFTLIRVYKSVFRRVAYELFREETARREGTTKSVFGNDVCQELGATIYRVGATYGYVGAFLGELNYALTRFIQRVPQIMVETGKWPEKNELRYWSYACATEALWAIALETKDRDIGLLGVFMDIALEYKWRVNRSYEAAQIVKSGDCYYAPWYTRVIEVVDESGSHIGRQEVYLERSPETLDKDVLDYVLVLKKKKPAKPKKPRAVRKNK